MSAAAATPARGWRIIRSSDQEPLDIFMICAILTVLGLRAYLKATHYPKIGGGGLHIAHVLWGGLAMVIAIGILLGFISLATRRLAAVVGGIGFGLFIDELGKFVTSDNNYFFRPTAALVYVVFVALFLAGRWVRTFRRLSPQEDLVNVIEYSKELASGTLTTAERDHALSLLASCDQSNPLVSTLRSEFLAIAPPADRPSPIARLMRAAEQRYVVIVEGSWFRRLFPLLFVAQAIGVLISALAFLLVAGAAFTGNADAREALAQAEHGSFVTWVQTAAAVIGGAFTFLGVWHLRRSRLHAYRDFEFAVLVDLLLAQPFSLLTAGFGGALQVFVDLALLGTLRFLHEQEHRFQARVATASMRGPGQQPAAASS